MLTTARVRELVHLYEHDRWTITQLKDRYGVSFATVSRIVNGHTWVEVTGGRNISRTGELTAYRCAHIATRLEQGQTNHRIIGEELGITRQAVRKLIVTKNLGGQPCSAA